MAGAALVFCLSAIVCVAVGRVAIQILRRTQARAPVRYEDCAPLLAYQQSKAATPTMGGLIILAVGIGIAAVAGGLSSREGWLVCAAIVGLGAIGLCDDVLKFQGPNAVGLRSVPKLASALAVGAAIGVLSSPPSRTQSLWELYGFSSANAEVASAAGVEGGAVALAIDAAGGDAVAPSDGDVHAAATSVPSIKSITTADRGRLDLASVVRTAGSLEESMPSRVARPPTSSAPQGRGRDGHPGTNRGVRAMYSA